MIEYAKTFIKKWGTDNVGMLAAVIAWNLLTSLVPIVVGLVAITGLVLAGNPGAQGSVVSHLSNALHGVLTTKDIRQIVDSSTKHAGILGIIGFVGILWGGSNVGGAISTTFQAIFETKGRNFVIEKLLDAGMILVMAALMIVIIVGTTAGSLVTHLFSGFPLGPEFTYVLGTIISVLAAFLLFAAIYLAFPNTRMRFRGDKVWKGALTGAVLFTILSYIWPIYTQIAHFSRYGAVLFPILMLTAWLYFFAVIVCIGAEVVAIDTLRDADRSNASVGPKPQETVPQHQVLRDDADDRPTPKPTERQEQREPVGAAGPDRTG